MDKEFLTKVIDAMLGFQGQVFRLDNFDLLLIIQAASHLERSQDVSEDYMFMSKLTQLTQMCDTFALKNLDSMNIHEYTTTVIYYMNHPEICSSQLKRALLNKMNESVQEFNEYQLHIFRRLINKATQGQIDRVDQDLIAEIDLKLVAEIEEVQRAKILMAGEEKIREEIRRRLLEKMRDKEAEAKKAKTFKLTGTDADKKLGMPRSAAKEIPQDQ